MTQPVLVHVVLLGFRPAATTGERDAFIKGVEGLLRASSTASDYRFGFDTGRVVDSDHFDFSLSVTFPGLEEYLAYEASPEHDAFVRECASPIVVARATAQHWWTEPAVQT